MRVTLTNFGVLLFFVKKSSSSNNHPLQPEDFSNDMRLPDFSCQEQQAFFECLGVTKGVLDASQT